MSVSFAPLNQGSLRMSSRRARGNARGGSRRQATAYSQMPFGILKRESVQLMDMAREEQLDLIHSKSLELLRDYGAEFMSLEAQDLLEEAGCKVDRSNGRVRPVRDASAPR